VTAGTLRWCAYIQEHPDVLRLLSARGDVNLVEGVVGNEGRISEFLSKLSDREKDSRLLYGLMYLLRPELREFVLGPLTGLVRSAARATKKTMVVSRTGVRGPVQWQHTLISRITGQLHPGSFEIRLNERHQDIPENQVLKLFLQSLVHLAARLVEDVTSGVSAKQLAVLQERAGKLLRASWLQEITSRRGITSSMIRRALRSKDRRYAQIVRFQREYEAVFQRPKWTFILLLINKHWLQPVADDDVFELYSLLRTLDVLRSKMGFVSVQQLGLIAKNRRQVAILRSADSSGQVHVYFDQSPVSVFGIASSYKQLIDEYEDLQAQSRRPDMSLRYVSANSERRLLIECKDTMDDGYRRDSVYKAFGYLQDFRELWSQQSQVPKIIVLFPTSIKRKELGQAEVMLVCADDDPALLSTLQSALLV
jgi:hypothetical protein